MAGKALEKLKGMRRARLCEARSGVGRGGSHLRGECAPLLPPRGHWGPGSVNQHGPAICGV